MAICWKKMPCTFKACQLCLALLIAPCRRDDQSPRRALTGKDVEETKLSAIASPEQRTHWRLPNVFLQEVVLPLPGSDVVGSDFASKKLPHGCVHAYT